jgi:hypothetical protein
VRSQQRWHLLLQNIVVIIIIISQVWCEKHLEWLFNEYCVFKISCLEVLGDLIETYSTILHMFDDPMRTPEAGSNHDSVPDSGFPLRNSRLSLIVHVALLNSQNVHVSETTVSKAIGGDSAASQIGDTY